MVRVARLEPLEPRVLLSAAEAIANPIVADVEFLIVVADNPAAHVVPRGTELDGVVKLRVDGVTVCSGALLTSGFHILTAAHCLADNDGDPDADTVDVTFELPAGNQTIRAATYFVHPQYNGDALNGYDVALVKLPVDAPAAAPRYDIYRGSDEIGQVHEKVGYGRTGIGATGDVPPAGIKHSGSNVYDSLADLFDDGADPFFEPGSITPGSQLAFDFDNGSATNDAFDFFFGISDTGLGDAEVMTAPGDSGGPTFIDGRIAGVASYRFGFNGGPDALAGTNSSFGDMAVDTRVSFVQTWIDAVTGPPVAGDIDGDTHADIVWRNGATGENAIWWMNGTQLASASSLTQTSNQDWVIGGVGNFNDDHEIDVLWRNKATGENAVWLMRDLAIDSAVSLLTTPNLDWVIGGADDFNRDGHTDVLWRNTQTGQNALWLMQGTQFHSAALLTTTLDQSWVIAGTGDFNHDGDVDILWRHQESGANALWFMTATVYTASTLIESWSDLDWQIGSAGDFNTDGHVDIVWRNGVTGENAVWLMNGTVRQSTVPMMTTANLDWQMIGTQDKTPPPSEDPGAPAITSVDVRSRLGDFRSRAQHSTAQVSSRFDGHAFDVKPIDVLATMLPKQV